MALPLIGIGAGILAGLGSLITLAVTSGIFAFVAPLIAKLGLGVVSFLALEPLVNKTLQQAMTYLALPSEIQLYAGVLLIDKVITIWFSVVSIKLVLFGLTKIQLGTKS